MTWLNELKVAVIEEDINSIQKLIKKIPEIKDINTAKEALALIKQAIAIVDAEKQKTMQTMQKIKKIKAFLKN
jgi:hypothetical protein